MPEIRFSPMQGSVADYVMNHPTASPFAKHNITFHIEGNYLQDFTEKGIKKFVNKNNDDLSFKEVSAFIQSVAANAPQVAGASFDLADKELGLYEKDAVKTEHIRTGFVLDTKSGHVPSKDVVFFDANKSKFPLLDAEKEIKSAEKGVKDAEGKVKDAKDDVEDAQYLRQRLVDFLGKDSPRELAEKDGLIQTGQRDLKDLEQEKGEYTKRLNQLLDEHNNQPANPPSGMNQAQRWETITQLKRAIRGLDAEIKQTQDQVKDTQKSVNAKQGPLSFMGIGNSLSELRERNGNLSKAQKKFTAVQDLLNQANKRLSDAKSVHERILKGGAFADEPAPVKPQPPAPPEAPVQQQPAAPPAPPEAPVQQQPAAPPAPPEAPVQQQPAAPPAPPEAPVQQQPAAPPAPPEAPVQQQPAAPPAPPEAPVQQQPAAPPAPPEAPVQQPAAPPAQPQPVMADETFTPGNQTNAVLDEEVMGAPVAVPAPTAPVSQPEPVSQTAPVQPVAPAAPNRSYTVKTGDTLSSIARQELGNWKRWNEIAELNKKVIGTENRHWIYPGQSLLLPPSQLRPTN